MYKIAVLLKSFAGDLQYVDRLIKSFNRYNRESIHLYIVVPKFDIDLFSKYKNRNITTLIDEEITDNLIHDNHILNIRPGYVNQEIIKLAFWKKGFCKNYFCLDSEVVFIKNFFEKDFIYKNDTPYTIIDYDNELIVDKEYFNTHWVKREKYIRKIQKSIGLKDNRLLTCHSFAIFSSKVLESMYFKFMKPNNLSYSDLINISPYEYSWYNMWLQKDKTIELQIREPLIKFFHQKSQHLDYLRRGVTINDMRRSFIGYNINSNYSRGYGVVSYNESYKYWPPVNLEAIAWRIRKRLNV